MYLHRTFNGRFSSHSMRYDSHQACVRCVLLLVKVVCLLALTGCRRRRRALKFWSQVQIGSDECWDWMGCRNRVRNNLSLRGAGTALAQARSTIRKGLCGTRGATLALLVLRLLAAISTAAILSILFHSVSACLSITIAI